VRRPWCRPLTAAAGHRLGDDAADGDAVGARREVERHAVAQDRLGQCHHVVDRRARRPSSTARARAASISAWLARGPGPQATCRRTSSISELSGRPERTRLQDRLDHALADRHAAHEALGRHQLGRVEHA
jgi:hypothetical protein